MEELDQHVTKIVASERQLREAIRLFFEQRDSVPIFTLCAAAHQVLQDICKEKDINGHMGTEFISEQYKKPWVCAIKGAAAFFKHADRDPEGVKIFNSQLTHFVIMDSISMYHALIGDIFIELEVFKTWFFMRYPGMLKINSDDSGSDTNDFVEVIRSLDVTYKDYHIFRKLISEKSPWQVS
ncbi:MAG: hypothetical protein IME93_02385 [Proteobacteria bacterium]|nr:hypothetical protein [Pseudomonadota bacterium]